jgi:lipopolysaccharide export system permease protein
MFRILDKYIFLQLIPPFFFGFFLFVTIIAIDPIMQAMQNVVNENIPYEVVWRWFYNRLPQDMIYTFPMSVLLANLLVFGRMSKDSETTAMRAGGINFFRILVPVIFFATIITAVSFLFNEKVVPQANEKARKIRRSEINRIIEPETTENSILRISDGAFAYARRVNEKRGHIDKILLEYYDDEGVLQKRVSADSAEWVDDAWVFNAHVEQVYNQNQELVSTTNNPKMVMTDIKERPADFARQTKRTVEMSYKELKQVIESYEQTQFMDTTEMRVGLAMKTSLPFAAIFFAIIGASYGLTNSRGGAFIGFGVSIAVIFCYYILMSLFSAIGNTGAIPPMVAAWGQNVCFAVLGFFIVRRINA